MFIVLLKSLLMIVKISDDFTLSTLFIETMGIVNTICALVMSTTPGINVLR